MNKSKLEPLFRRLGAIAWVRHEDWDEEEVIKIINEIKEVSNAK